MIQMSPTVWVEAAQVESVEARSRVTVDAGRTVVACLVTVVTLGGRQLHVEAKDIEEARNIASRIAVDVRTALSARRVK